MHAPGTPARPDRNPETGGITILVTLLLLILLTIAAVAMTKNALREVIITGTSRQAAQVRNLADTGIEWSVYWMTEDGTGTRATPSTSTGPGALRALKNSIVASQLTGITSAAVSTSDMTLSAGGVDPVQSFQVFLTFMSDVSPGLTGNEVHGSSINATSPATVQLWSTRSDGYVTYAGGPVFLHRREAWFTVPPSTLP